MKGCHDFIRPLANSINNDATGGYDFAIALVICITLSVIAIVIVCKWFDWKKFVCREAACKADKQHAAEIACSERKANVEMLNKLLKALADGPQGLEKEDYMRDDLYFKTRSEEHKAYIAQLRALLKLPEPTDNENKA